jgi:histidinol-phosphate aminotransferase
MTATESAVSEPLYARERRIGGTTWLDANESPYPPPSPVRAKVLAYPPLNRYGDPECTPLISALAEELQVPRESVLLGPGSSALLQRLIAVSCPAPGDAAMWASPGFDAVEQFVRQAGAAAQRIPLTPEGATDLEGMLAAITPQTRLVLLVNPHNPTGAVIHGAELRGFLDRVGPEVTVLLDEAYHEFCDDPRVVDGAEVAKARWAAGLENVAVVRTFSKAYGLAAMRVGYGIAPPALARAVRAAGVPREIGSLAHDTALAALYAKTAMRQDVAVVIRERARVLTELRRLGYAPLPSRGNFLFLPLGDDSVTFVRHCRTTGVHVLGVADRGVRVTVGDLVDNDSFLHAAFTWAAGQGEA